MSWTSLKAHPANVCGHPGQHLVEGEVEVENAEHVRVIPLPGHLLLLHLSQIYFGLSTSVCEEAVHHLVSDYLRQRSLRRQRAKD